MKITKRQLRRIIREAMAPAGSFIKYGSVAEVMAGIAGYYRAEYGPDADEFIQGNPTIRDFLFNDEFAVEEMAEVDYGNLSYDPVENTVYGDGFGLPQPIPGDLAAVAKDLYEDDGLRMQEGLLPQFLHLITGSEPRIAAFIVPAKISYR